MAGNCCGSIEAAPRGAAPGWRRALWIALALNAGMFLVEIIAGVAADSRALQADALDFLGDAANYAISLGVAGFALVWRSRAALLKGWTLIVLALWVIGSTAWALWRGASPEPFAMGGIGIAALVTNIGVALMLYRFRSGDANMRSVWICSRNDAIGNVAVVAAAAGVLGTGSALPDLAVAMILAALGLSGGWQIIRQARGELKQVHQAREKVMA